MVFRDLERLLLVFLGFPSCSLHAVRDARVFFVLARMDSFPGMVLVGLGHWFFFFFFLLSRISGNDTLGGNTLKRRQRHRGKGSEIPRLGATIKTRSV